MARPIWQGTISFGLVVVPVALYSATEDHTVSFHQLQRGTSDRIRYRRVNARTGKEVDLADIVKGYEVDEGEYVVVEPDELAEIAPEKSRGIEIETFVELEEIDPAFFGKTYYLAPTDDSYAHAYHLLLRAMAAGNRVGIARFVMRGKEYLTAIRAGDQVITLETMYFSDEIRDPASAISNLPAPDQPRERELSMAIDLIESMTGPWRPDDYHDTYQERVRELIDNKRQGRKTKPAAAPREPTKVVDLTEALQRSVRRSGTRSGTAKSTASGMPESAARKESAPDPSTLSKADLDRMARELDIRGRSRMTRSELVDAVTDAAAEASGGAGRRGPRGRRRAS